MSLAGWGEGWLTVEGTPPTTLGLLERGPSTPHLKLPGATVVVLQQGPVSWVGVMSNPNLPLDLYVYRYTAYLKGFLG